MAAPKEARKAEGIVPPAVHAIAGTSAGMIATAMTYPLDLVKTRFQVQDVATPIKSNIPRYTGTINALTTISRTEGLRALYNGLSPNLVGSGVAWGAYFYAFNVARDLMRDMGIITTQHPGPWANTAAATSAGVLTAIVTNPIWVVKTRMQLQHGTERHYTGLIGGLTKITQEEGFRGLYRGFVASLFGISHGVVQFVAYEEIKQLFGHGKRLSDLEYLTGAAASKIIASVATYPYQVIRTRQQDHRTFGQYKGTWDTFSKVLNREGVYGFYKGLVPTVIRVTPSSCITFYAYERIKNYLMDREEARLEGAR